MADDLTPRFVPIYDHVGTFRLVPIEDLELGTGGGGLRVHRVIDADFTVEPASGTDVVVYVEETLTAPRSVYLPPASGPTQNIIVSDFDGFTTDDNQIACVSDGDDIGPPFYIGPTGASPGMVMSIVNDGASGWVTISDTSTRLEEARVLLGMHGGAPQINGVPVVRAFPFAFDTPDLLTGAALYTPTVGDVWLDAWVAIVAPWNGTTPTGDIGTFDLTDIGTLSALSGTDTGIDMSVADSAVADTVSNVVGNLTTPTDIISAQVKYFFNHSEPLCRYFPAKFITDTPIKVCVSQNGRAGGDDPGSTAGAAVLYLVTATPVSA